MTKMELIKLRYKELLTEVQELATEEMIIDVCKWITIILVVILSTACTPKLDEPGSIKTYELLEFSINSDTQNRSIVYHYKVADNLGVLTINNLVSNWKVDVNIVETPTSPTLTITTPPFSEMYTTPINYKFNLPIGVISNSDSINIIWRKNHE